MGMRTGDNAERDEVKRRLEQEWPGWSVWYVPRALGGGAVWSARPLPLLNADSPEELVAKIRTAHAEPGDQTQAIASLRSYRMRIKLLRERQEAARAAWIRLKARRRPARRKPSMRSQDRPPGVA